jgi:hypothetical protein
MMARSNRSLRSNVEAEAAAIAHSTSTPASSNRSLMISQMSGSLSTTRIFTMFLPPKSASILVRFLRVAQVNGHPQLAKNKTPRNTRSGGIWRSMNCIAQTRSVENHPQASAWGFLGVPRFIHVSDILASRGTAATFRPSPRAKGNFDRIAAYSVATNGLDRWRFPFGPILVRRHMMFGRNTAHEQLEASAAVEAEKCGQRKQISLPPPQVRP